MNIHGNCQKCRQPLSFGDESVAALTRSTYDLLSASERRPHPPSGAVPLQPAPPSRTIPGLSRLTQQQRQLYDAASRTTAASFGGPSSSRTPSQRVQVVSPREPLGPTESFVVLDHHVAQSLAALPAPSQPRSDGGNVTAAAGTPSSAPASHSHLTSTNTDERQPPTAAPLSPHLSQLGNLYTLLSSRSSVDYPLCTECIEVLLGMMSKELEEGKKERERLLAFEKDVLKKREEGGGQLGREALQKEIAKYKRAERQAADDLKAVEAEREELDREKAELDAEEAELAKEEELFWRDHSAYLLEEASLRDRTNAMQTRYAHDVKELDKLQKTNVYNDAFCIGQEAGFGTINGLRFGRLPNIPVEWPEINAAWGHTLLLLHTIARKFAFTFDNYRLVPVGSFSRIEKLGGDRAVYELYGSGDFAVTRLLQNRRFDMAMVAFLDCLRQLGEHVVQRDRGFKLPHLIVKDKIGDVSIRLQFGSDEAWTRALRHVLLNLKILLGRASL